MVISRYNQLLALIQGNARAENLDRQEERLQEILDLTNDVGDVLDVERQFERVRGEIETHWKNQLPGEELRHVNNLGLPDRAT